MLTLGDRYAVELLMNLKNSTQHQQPGTQFNADIKQDNDQSHKEQGVFESGSHPVCKILQRKDHKSSLNPNEG